MTIAHIAGLPFEEWLGPLMATGSGIAVVVRALVRRHPTPTPTPTSPSSRN